MRCFARFIIVCTILKNVKDTHGRVLLLVKLQVEACNLTKSNTSPSVCFTIKPNQIAQEHQIFQIILSASKIVSS